MIGPLGEFHIPDAPVTTRDHVRGLSAHVFAGEYDHPELPTEGIETILDIGCGWGAFAVWARKKWPDAALTGYDPHLEALVYFRKNAPWATCTPLAISAKPDPMYGVSWEWGSGHTHGRTTGITVPWMHPRYLPPADLVKIDAEGIEPDVVTEYRHLSRLKALIYEFHSPEHRIVLRRLCQNAGMRNVVEAETDYGTAIWLPR